MRNVTYGIDVESMKLSVGIVVGLPTYIIELNTRLKAKVAFRGANTAWNQDKAY